MMRILLIDLIMFALPFVVYGGYVYMVRGKRTSGEIWGDAPVYWLFGAGCLLVIGVLVAFISFSNVKPGGVYHPPILKDGKIIEGEITKK